MNENNGHDENARNGELPLNTEQAAPVAEKNGNQVLVEKAAEMGLIRIPAKFMRMKELAENSDLTGSTHLIYRGAALMSLPEAQEVRANLSKAIINTTDPIAKAALSGAYAAVMRGEAAYIKAVTDAAPSSGRSNQKGRRTFAKGAMMGPPIDVKAS